MNNTDTKRQMPKKTEATSNADADAADAGPFFSHTCVYTIMRYKSGISHQRLPPPETMYAILPFNANFKTYASHVIQKLF